MATGDAELGEEAPHSDGHMPEHARRRAAALRPGQVVVARRGASGRFIASGSPRILGGCFGMCTVMIVVRKGAKNVRTNIDMVRIT